MLKPLQHRTLGISGDALPTWGGEPVLAPMRLRGTEALGRLYRYTLDVVTVERPTLSRWQAQELVVPDDLIGQVVDVAIDLADGGFFGGEVLEAGEAGDVVDAGFSRRTISGLITDVTLTGTDDRRAWYRFTVRPWLLNEGTFSVRLFYSGGKPRIE